MKDYDFSNVLNSMYIVKYERQIMLFESHTSIYIYIEFTTFEKS
jgi:hypothetical protein